MSFSLKTKVTVILVTVAEIARNDIEVTVMETTPRAGACTEFSERSDIDVSMH
jgi:hypothetical protein